MRFVSVTSVAGIGHRERALRAIDRLPPFSPMLTKLVAAMAREDVSFAELAGLIEKDTVIAAHVLRVVNSAAYGHTGAIGSIRHALTLMGLTKLRNTVFGLSMSRMWMSVRTASGWNASSFNQHSVATGILADQLATTVPTNYPEGAFVAGLLHDIGKLLIAVSFPDEFAHIDRLCREGPGHVSHEREILGFDHAELSACAMARWNLPAEVQEAAHYHHVPEQASSRPGELPLALIIHSADRVANLLRLELFPAESDQPVQDPSIVFESLGIPEAAGAILEEFEREFAALCSAI